MARFDLPLPTVGLIGGVAASAYVFFANLGESQRGVIPLMTGRLAKNVSISPRDKVTIWTNYYKSGAVWMVGSTVLGAICSGIAATTHPSQIVQRFAMSSAAVGLSIVPFTLLFIAPTNNELLKLDESLSDVAATSTEGKRVDELISQWDSLHHMRYFMYAGSFVLALAGLVYDGRIIVDIVDVVYSVTGAGSV